MQTSTPSKVYKKLKVAIVDDDESLHDIMTDMYSDSDMIEVKYNFTSSKKFMEEVALLDFDLCFLDISMPSVNGLLVAQKLNKKPFIFITGSEDKLKDALNLEPIDVVTKPFNKNRLDHAINRAFELIGEK